MLSLSPPCEVNLIQNFGVLLLIFLLFSSLENQEENKCRSAEASNQYAADSKRLRTSITGHRSNENSCVHNCQWRNCVGRISIHLIVEHCDVVAVNRCRCSLIVMCELRLWDVREVQIEVAIEVITRVILHDAECIFAVNVARTVCIIDGRNRYVDVILE